MESLVTKGVPLGTALALMSRLIAVFFATVTLCIMVVGFTINGLL